MKTSVFAVTGALTLLGLATAATAETMVIANPISGSRASNAGEQIEDQVMSAIKYMGDANQSLEEGKLLARFDSVDSAKMTSVVTDLVQQNRLSETSPAVATIMNGEYDFADFYAEVQSEISAAIDWFEARKQRFATLSIQRDDDRPELMGLYAHLNATSARVTNELNILSQIVQVLEVERTSAMA